LTNESIERLRFEYQKRQNTLIARRQKITIIQTKIARLSAEYEDAYAEYEMDRRARPWLYEEAGSWSGIIDSHPREMNLLEYEAARIEADISSIESEIAAIEEILNSRS
jgi:hypothetical protein